MIMSYNVRTIDWLLTELTRKYDQLNISRGTTHNYLGMVFDISHRHSPQRDYGVSDDDFRNPLTSTIINIILSIFTVFHFINTRDLSTYYVFQVEVNMNCCIA